MYYNDGASLSHAAPPHVSVILSPASWTIPTPLMLASLRPSDAAVATEWSLPGLLPQERPPLLIAATYRKLASASVSSVEGAVDLLSAPCTSHVLDAALTARGFPAAQQGLADALLALVTASVFPQTLLRLLSQRPADVAACTVAVRLLACLPLLEALAQVPTNASLRGALVAAGALQWLLRVGGGRATPDSAFVSDDVAAAYAAAATVLLLAWSGQSSTAGRDVAAITAQLTPPSFDAVTNVDVLTARLRALALASRRDAFVAGGPAVERVLQLRVVQCRSTGCRAVQFLDVTNPGDESAALSKVLSV